MHISEYVYELFLLAGFYFVTLRGCKIRPCRVFFRLTVCDLAGSERCKEQRNGERMKEATNINTSLLTLGRCIAALRSNQNNKYVWKCVVSLL